MRCGLRKMNISSKPNKVCCCLRSHEIVTLLAAAFYQAGRMDESYQVLNRLLSNSIKENRYSDAGYYSWLLAIYSEQMPDDLANDTGNNGQQQLYQKADIYYAYSQIYKYIVCLSIDLTSIHHH